MLPLALLPGSVALAVDHLALDGPIVILFLRTTASAAACPCCGQDSLHVHSRYVRHLHDLPLQGRQMLLELTVRRFFCRNLACLRKVFAEPLPDLACPHARSTSRMTEALRAIALSLGGEAGSRLAAKLAMPTSPDTLLRRIKQSPANPKPAPPPRVVGVDDWAILKGQTYGTIVVDLERGVVLDLLPGRDGQALKIWLSQHPQIEWLSRDRWSAFAEAANEAAPQAKQVADRWHLLKNAREALQRFLERQTKTIRELFSPPVPGAAPGVETKQPPTKASTAQIVPAPTRAISTATPQRVPTAKQQRRTERYEEVRRRHKQGQSMRQIAREMRLSWSVVRRYMRLDRCPDWRPGRTGPSLADNYRERIDAWLGEGNRNVAALHRQLQGEGSDLRYDALRRFVTRRLACLGVRRQRANAAEVKSPPPPSPRELSFAVIAKGENRSEKQRGQVARLRESDQQLAEAVELLEGFAAVVRKQAGASLDHWQEKAASSGCAEMRRFAQGLSQDKAVQAAMQESWSNGPVEGQVNRLKTIKRQMYGRASFELLRRRVLHRG